MINQAALEMPLITQLTTTVQTIGYEATLKHLTNACNKSVTMDDPKVQAVINAVLEELGISFDQLVARATRSNKKRQGLILVSYSLSRLKYSHTAIGKILGNRSRPQISRYHKTMTQASVGSLLRYKMQFDILIKTFKKIKTKSNANR